MAGKQTQTAKRSVINRPRDSSLNESREIRYTHHMQTRNDTVIFARNANGAVGIALPDRRYHMYLIGRTGTGKSTMLANMIIQDMAAGHGLVLIDPHGDLAQHVLAFVPPRRKNDLVYFDPSDVEFPIGLNVLERVGASERPLVAANLVSVFRKVFQDSWGPRMEYLLYNALLALLENPGSTLLGLLKLLTDEQFRKRIISNVTDPVVRHYWIEQFANFPERLLPEITSPVLNKIGAYLTHRSLRNILGQKRTAINFEQLVNRRGILIANLSKGRIGEDAANLLGSLLVTKLQFAAMARANIPEVERSDVFLYVDEFHNFVTHSFADILAEARKYRLGLVLSHQFSEQVHEHIRAAILGNCGTMVFFRIGPDDAKLFAKEVEPHYSWLDLVNLSPHEVIYKLQRNGKVDRPYQATTLAPAGFNQAKIEGYRCELFELSRRQYARPRAGVEDKINQIFKSDKKVL